MGSVLVFDLDETLSGEYPLPSSGIPILNEQLVNLIKRANEQKGKTVDAIFLLTNNGDEEFIKACVKEIGPGVFNMIMTANSKAINIKTEQPYPNRKRTNYAEKTIEDVKYMLNSIGKSIENIFNRCYFFDDNETHPLSKIENFIHIKPAFNRLNNFRGIPESKLEKVREAIEKGYNSINIGGARRKTRSYKKISYKYKKTRKNKNRKY